MSPSGVHARRVFSFGEVQCENSVINGVSRRCARSFVRSARLPWTSGARSGISGSAGNKEFRLGAVSALCLTVRWDGKFLYPEPHLLSLKRHDRIDGP